MIRAAIQESSVQAEDRAMLGSNPSADLGVKTERRAMDSSLARLSRTLFGIGIKAKNPSRPGREFSNFEMPGDGLPHVPNTRRPVLNFTLNHYRIIRPLQRSFPGEAGAKGQPFEGWFPRGRIRFLARFNGLEEGFEVGRVTSRKRLA